MRGDRRTRINTNKMPFSCLPPVWFSPRRRSRASPSMIRTSITDSTRSEHTCRRIPQTQRLTRLLASGGHHWQNTCTFPRLTLSAPETFHGLCRRELGASPVPQRCTTPRRPQVGGSEARLPLTCTLGGHRGHGRLFQKPSAARLVCHQARQNER